MKKTTIKSIWEKIPFVNKSKDLTLPGEEDSDMAIQGHTLPESGKKAYDNLINTDPTVYMIDEKGLIETAAEGFIQTKKAKIKTSRVKQERENLSGLVGEETSQNEVYVGPKGIAKLNEIYNTLSGKNDFARGTALDETIKREDNKITAIGQQKKKLLKLKESTTTKEKAEVELRKEENELLEQRLNHTVKLSGLNHEEGQIRTQLYDVKARNFLSSVYNNGMMRKLSSGYKAISKVIVPKQGWISRKLGKTPNVGDAYKFKDPILEFRDLAIENGRRNDAAIKKANADTLNSAAERAIAYLKDKK